MAKTRGGTVEVPRIRGENFTVAEKVLIFQEQGSQRIAEKCAKDCPNFAAGRRNTRWSLGLESLPRDSEVEREELYLNLKKYHINVNPI